MRSPRRCVQGAPTTLVATDLPTVTSSTPGIFDAVVDATGDVLFLAYQRTGGAGIKIVSFDITGTGASITITATGDSITSVHDPDQGISIVLDTVAGEVAVLASTGGANVLLHTTVYALSSITSDVVAAVSALGVSAHKNVTTHLLAQSP